MRTTKTLSVSMPLKQLNEMARRAKKEHRTMSALVRELYRRYVADAARQDFGRSLDTLREEASGTPAARLTLRQIDAEIRAARRARNRNRKPVR